MSRSERDGHFYEVVLSEPTAWLAGRKRRAFRYALKAHRKGVLRL